MAFVQMQMKVWQLIKKRVLFTNTLYASKLYASFLDFTNNIIKYLNTLSVLICSTHYNIPILRADNMQNLENFYFLLCLFSSQ